MATFKQINLHQRVQTANVGTRTQKTETGFHLAPQKKQYISKMQRKNSLKEIAKIAENERGNMNRTGLAYQRKPVNDLHEAEKRGIKQRTGDVQIGNSNKFDGITTKEEMQDGPIKTFKNQTVVDPMRNKKNDSNVKIRDVTVAGQTHTMGLDCLRPNTAKNAFDLQKDFLASQSQHQSTMRAKQTNLFALHQGANRATVWTQNAKREWNQSLSQSETKVPNAKLYASLQSYSQNQEKQTLLQGKLKQQNFNVSMNNSGVRTSTNMNYNRSAQKNFQHHQHGNKMTSREMQDILNIYSSMRKNSVPVMNNTSKYTRYTGNDECRRSIPGPLDKNKLDQEKSGNKSSNQRTNLPFSKDLTPATAQVDGQYGSTMYSLKQKNTDPKYVASNYNTNTNLNQTRHEDQLVQHHKVGYEANMRLQTEKGKAFTLSGEKLQHHKTYFESKQGPVAESQNNKAVIEKQNFEVQIRNHSTRDFGNPFNYLKPTESLTISTNLDHRKTNFSFGNRAISSTEAKKQVSMCGAPDRIAVGSGQGHGKTNVFMGRDNNLRLGSDYRQNFNKQVPSVWSKPGTASPQVFGSKPSTAAGGGRTFNVPGGFQPRQNNIF